MNRIKEIINSYCTISIPSLEKIEAGCSISSFQKGTPIFSKGQRNHHEYFILNGVCRTYVLDPEGNEITLNFYDRNTILAPYITRTREQSSLYHFQALTNDVQIAQINANTFEQLMVDDLEIRHFGNQVLQKELMDKSYKEIGLASQTAKERLIQFRQRFPMLENLVPHPAIASYLGITNISLSRLRKEKME